MRGTVYGIPLDQLMVTPREKGRDVPTVIEKATEWIIMHGNSHSISSLMSATSKLSVDSFCFVHLQLCRWKAYSERPEGSTRLKTTRICSIRARPSSFRLMPMLTSLLV